VVGDDAADTGGRTTFELVPPHAASRATDAAAMRTARLVPIITFGGPRSLLRAALGRNDTVTFAASSTPARLGRGEGHLERQPADAEEVEYLMDCP